MKAIRIVLIVGVSAAAVVIIPAVMVALHLAVQFRVVEGVAEQRSDLYETRDLRILWRALPAGATDIRYYVQRYRVHVDASFSITEEEFAAWAEKSGWNVMPIETPVELRPETSEDKVIVDDGYHFKEGKRLDSGLQVYLHITFDRGTGRAYYMIMMF